MTSVLGPRGLGTPILRDAKADRQLRIDGFTIVPSIDPSALAELRTSFLDWRGPAGVGFEADLTNPDSTHRREVADRLAPHLGARCQAHFLGHVPFLWNYLVKWPDDPEDFYFHRDWMFVDERQGHRSFLVWTPLQDIVGDNGVLRVLPRSHRLRGPLTGTELAPGWLAHRDEIDAAMVSVPVRAGQSVVFDHALVHGSFRNLTDEPRVVVGCAMRPAAAPLVHFRRDAPGRAVRFRVDEEFFVTETPQDLMERPPARYDGELIDDPGDGFEGAEELVDRLGRFTRPVGRAADRAALLLAR